MRIPDDDAAHADGRENRAYDIDAAVARVRDIVNKPDAGEDDPDDHDLAGERDAPRQVRRDEPAEAVARPPPRSPQRRRRVRTPSAASAPRSCHGSATASRAAATTRPGRRRRPRRSRSAAGSARTSSRARRPHSRAARGRTRACGPIRSPTLLPIRMNAAETSASSAIADLHAARRRVEVAHDGGDRHVHQRGVDDEHEHRHRQEDRQPGGCPRPLRPAVRLLPCSSDDPQGRAAGRHHPVRTRSGGLGGGGARDRAGATEQCGAQRGDEQCARKRDAAGRHPRRGR